MTAAAVGVLMSIERVNRLEARQGIAAGIPEAQGFPVEMKPRQEPAKPEAPARRHGRTEHRDGMMCRRGCAGVIDEG